jgi:hypothetical protein
MKNFYLSIFFFVFAAKSYAFPFGERMISLDEDVNYNESWYQKNKSDEENFNRLITGISKSEAGRGILSRARDKAREQGMTLIDVLAVGDGSLTDTTLVRRFQSSDPTIVTFESRSKVYINRHLKTLDAMLDLAHELTHYTFREAFNPYDSRFKLKDFIKSTVEGRGGEVDAYLVECQVLKEILPGEVGKRSNCYRVYDKKTGMVSKDMGVEEFYKVGNHFTGLMKEFSRFAIDQTEVPKITKDDAIFISSAWGLPYPVAAVREYENIMDRVCKNDQNRLSLIQSKVDRMPASTTNNDSQYRLKNMFEDYKIRCQMFNKNS